MLMILLSPSKTMRWDHPYPPETAPALLSRAEALAALLRDDDAAALARWMRLSPALAAAAHADLRAWTPTGRGAALFAYAGEAFRALDAPTLPPAALARAQRRLRVLSGLYGVLRPLDAVCPYRLEAASRPPRLGAGGVCGYWREHVTRALNDDIAREGATLVLNLASQEYAALLDPAALHAPLLAPALYARDASGARRVVSVYAKRARGLLARHALLSGAETREGLEGFCLDGYRLVEGPGLAFELSRGS
ncbi:MAG: YaaA family protein [Deltaproteobacteria bacterium]|nr:YaaA family protein [Deltaproteobacteria bacterium]